MQVSAVSNDILQTNALYEQRGREGGHDVDDWLRAEAELTAQAMKTAA